uniref:Uncharacterized protein n=1 Tax=Thuretia quercifolia TaxID=189650 RepID=A0A1Z1MJW7_9FLOR|nr:hypothetical protein [Thuretia quercifolia]ARW66380.1 hypothetical protein [Thuretia quercifolia]
MVFYYIMIIIKIFYTIYNIQYIKLLFYKLRINIRY